jgi:Tfp pilus assembly protein PilN
MGLAKANEVVSFAWGATGGISLAVTRRAGDGLLLVEARHLDVDENNRWKGLAGAIKNHVPSTADSIVIGGPLPGSACLDFPFPSLSGNDLKEALRYEIPRFFPMEPSELQVGFRQIHAQAPEGMESKTTIRVFAARRDDWEDFIFSLSAAGAKFDAYLHPFMAVDPLFAEKKSIYFQDVEPNRLFLKEASKRKPVEIPTQETHAPIGIRETLESCGYDVEPSIDAIPEEAVEKEGTMAPALLLAAFALSAEYRNATQTLPTIPSSLKPERYRRARALTFTLAAACAVLSLGILGRNLWEVWSAHSKLKAERLAVEKRTAALQNSNTKLASLDKEVLVKISDAASNIHNPVFILHKLAAAIPEGMWLYKLSIKKNALDINVKGSGGQGASKLLAALNSTGMFKTKSSYSKSWKGMESVYVSMAIINNHNNTDKESE